VTRILAVTTFALGLLACDSPSPSDPIAQTQVRTAMVDKLAEGTEVLVTFSWSGVPAGTTFMVQGAGSGEGAFCTTSIGTTLYLQELTLVGGAADPDELRFINFTFSTPMPPGTKFEVIGLASPVNLCAGSYIYRAVVINGSGN
jgi:hypothetical protein